MRKNPSSDNDALSNISEKDLQRCIRAALRNPDLQWLTRQNVPISVLSVGEWNQNAGPDFLNMALQADGRLLIGHGEVHKRSSDWEQHRHSNDEAYRGLLLHIVLRDNRANIDFARYTLVIDEAIIKANLHAKTNLAESAYSSESEAVLREFAEQRFFNKSNFAAALLEHLTPKEAFARLTGDFCQRRLQKKHLPQGIKRLAEVNAESPDFIPFFDLLEKLAPAPKKSITPSMVENHIQAILEESAFGKGTTLELMTNTLLPLLYALTAQNENIQNESTRKLLLRIFFGLRAQNHYAHLKARFPAIPQHYVWQQQGLLEYEIETSIQPTKPSFYAASAHFSEEMIITLYCDENFLHKKAAPNKI